MESLPVPMKFLQMDSSDHSPSPIRATHSFGPVGWRKAPMALSTFLIHNMAASGALCITRMELLKGQIAPYTNLKLSQTKRLFPVNCKPDEWFITPTARPAISAMEKG